MTSMRYIFLMANLCLFININLTAQSCPINRYVDDIFTSQVTEEPEVYATVDAVVYPPFIAEFLTYSRDLSFDFYEPQGDTLSKRPLIVIAFGGAFLVGSKRQAELVDYCEAMARKGYCVASIDYRIGYNALSSNSAIRAVYRGAQDFRAAVRFFRENASNYKIDVDHVFGAGASAGGLNAIHATYLDEADRTPTSLLAPTFNNPDLGCLDCSGNAFAQSSISNAVVNLWGAIGNVNWIEAGESPIISFHGTDDTTVNPDVGPPFGVGALFPNLYGSIPIHAQTDAVGIDNELYLFPGEGHELWNDAGNASFIQQNSANYLYEYMKPDAPIIAGDLLVCEGTIVDYCVTSPNPDAKYCWNISGANIISQSQTCISVEWPVGQTNGLIELREYTCLDAASDPVFMAVSVNPFPTSDFTFTYNNEMTQFTSLSDPSLMHSWDFGGGNTSNLLNPSHTFQSNGSFNVTLTVTDANACSHDLTLTVDQQCQPTLFVTDDPTLTGLYQVFNWISSDKMSDINADIFFKAGDYIEMLDGFSIDASTDFEATIEQCQNVGVTP